MARIPMQVIGTEPFRGVAPGGEVRVTNKDARAFASQLGPVGGVKAGPRKAAKKAVAKKAAKKAPAKKSAKTYNTRALKAR